MERSAITGEANMRFCKHHEQWEIFVEKIRKNVEAIQRGNDMFVR